MEDAKRLIQQYVDHYNHVRLPQRDRVRGAERHAQGSASRDPRGARPEAGSGSPVAPNCDGARRTGQMATPRANGTVREPWGSASVSSLACGNRALACVESFLLMCG